MTWRLSGFVDEAGLSIEEQLEAAKQSQLRYIDLRGIGDGNISSLPADQASAVRSQLDAAGLTVNMFGSPIGKIDITDGVRSDLDKLEHLARMADIFDCRAVRVFSYFNKTGIDPVTWGQQAIERLGTLRAKAMELGLSIWLENERHIFGDRLPEVMRILDELHDGESFRMIFDFDNFNQSGDNCYANWQKLKGRVDAFHLKDSTKEAMHVPIGQGAGYAREILTEAKASGWQGSLSLEPHLAHSPAVMATGPHGEANQALSDLSPTEAFVFATEEARKLLREIGADFE